MKVESLKVAFFSPTGGTGKAAHMLAELFGFPVEMIDLTLPEARNNRIDFGDGDLVLVACPVFGGTMPRVEGLFDNLHGDMTPCILMAAYGNRHYDNALAQMRSLMESHGFRVLGAIAPVIPHAFSDILGATRPDEKDKKAFAEFVLQIQQIINGESASFTELPGDGTVSSKKIPAMPKTWDAEVCVHCGICAEKCPAGAIDPDSLAIDNELCINCTRCSRVCPMNARTQDYAASTAKLEANFTVPRQVEYFIISNKE